VSCFYGKYKKIRNASWQLILDCGITSVPVDARAICEQMHIGVADYEEAAAVIDALGLLGHSACNDGFALYFDKNWYVFYRKLGRSIADINFVILHELGHILLGHKMRTKRTVSYTTENVEKEPEEKDAVEREADMFSARVMAPACLLKELGIHTPEEIAAVCGMPYFRAKNRAKRMEKLYRRDLFYKSEMEKKVCAQLLAASETSG
jgi:Zn-dependent peptidase ImmA (M78 family)